jgi:hypothetical protein
MPPVPLLQAVCATAEWFDLLGLFPERSEAITRTSPAFNLGDISLSRVDQGVIEKGDHQPVSARIHH